jgi:hypothetical protein
MESWKLALFAQIWLKKASNNSGRNHGLSGNNMGSGKIGTTTNFWL